MKRYLNPITWFRWLTEFFIAWLWSLDWRNALWSIPFILITCCMGIGSAIAWSSGKAWRNRIISQELAEAYRDEEYAVVELLLKRRLRQEPEDAQLLLQLAEVRLKQDRKDESIEGLRPLALERKNGKAAVWLLKNAFDYSSPEKLVDDQVDDFRQLTEVAIAEFPDDLQVNAWRADALLKDGKVLEAVPHMEKLEKIQPMRALQIAVMLRGRQEEDRAAEFASRALRYVEDRVRDEPAKAEFRMAHAQSLIFLNRYDEAVNSLFAGLNLSKDERLRPALGETLVLYAAAVRKEGNSLQSIQKQMAILQRAMQFAPASPVVIKAISDTVLASAQDQSPEIKALRESLVSGASPAIAHFVRGTVALMEDDLKTASVELELAAKELPQSAAVLNNLAVATATQGKETNDEVAFDKALGFVDRAIDLAEKDTRLAASEQLLYFYETRGQIFLLQKRYTDAVAELEKALPVAGLREQVHRALADAYTGLGLEESAADHRAAAEKFADLRQESEINQPGENRPSGSR